MLVFFLSVNPISTKKIGDLGRTLALSLRMLCGSMVCGVAPARNSASLCSLAGRYDNRRNSSRFSPRPVPSDAAKSEGAADDAVFNKVL
jgi:hypothetical protein